MSTQSNDYDDAHIWAAAHLAAGGPVDFVQRFLHLVWEGHHDEARAYLDPTFDWGDIADMGLEALQLPGWWMSGRPRTDPEGREIVRFVYMEGVTEATVIDRLTLLPGSDFLVRETEDGRWLIHQITVPPKV
jgi:hypothetical protein